jgi:hypothetical protein
MREMINEELAKSLLESIRGKGEDVRFPKEEVEKDRQRQYQFFEESIRKERRRQAEAWEAASRIYITI